MLRFFFSTYLVLTAVEFVSTLFETPTEGRHEGVRGGSDLSVDAEFVFNALLHSLDFALLRDERGGPSRGGGGGRRGEGGRGAFRQLTWRPITLERWQSLLMEPLVRQPPIMERARCSIHVRSSTL